MAGKAKPRSRTADVRPFDPANYCPDDIDPAAWLRDPMAVHYAAITEYRWELCQELGVPMSQLPPITWARPCECRLCPS